jgi:hypothetical protein
MPPRQQAKFCLLLAAAAAGVGQLTRSRLISSKPALAEVRQADGLPNGNGRKPTSGAAPSRVLKGRALVAAARTARALTQYVARRVPPPPDDRDGARQWRVVLAARAIQPEPGRRAVQVAERGGRARGLHGADWTRAKRAESSSYPLWSSRNAASNSDPSGNIETVVI